MFPSEVKQRFGATHYSTMRDGVTPQMYYKLETTPLSDGHSFTCWVYLSYADLWVGSNIQIGSTAEGNLTKIINEVGDTSCLDSNWL